MPLPNFDGRAEIRFTYQTVDSARSISHRHTLDARIATIDSVVPGTIFEEIPLVFWDATTSNLQEMVNTYVTTVMKPLLSSTSDIIGAELWKYPATSVDGQFVSAFEIGINGTSVVPAVPAQQLTITFRSAGGGIMRTQLMEPGLAGNQQEAFPTVNGAVNAIGAYMTGVEHAWAARDDTKPIFALRLSLGQNEALARKRFRLI